MIKQGFHIGSRDWWVMVYYDINSDADLSEVGEALYAGGLSRVKIDEALDVLCAKNAGLTYTNFKEHLTFIFISAASDAEQMYDTIQHETRHAADHIGGYYRLNPSGETIAYLQGEIARKMFPAAAMVICPHCHS